MILRFIYFLVAIVLPTSAFASSGVSVNIVNNAERALLECTGYWHTSGTVPWTKHTALDLIPALRMAKGESKTLTYDQGRDIYRAARGLLAPSLYIQKGLLADESSSITCPARPLEAVALLQYLIGEHANDLRGPRNAREWLALAYEQSIGVQKDAETARILRLKWRIDFPFSKPEQWSDGIDNDIAENVRRAGLWNYLVDDAKRENGMPARRILAEDILDKNPTRARELLKDIYIPSIKRLLELEETGIVPTLHSRDELKFWTKASRTFPRMEIINERIHKEATALNNGPLVLSDQRVSRGLFKNTYDAEQVFSGHYSSRPIPLRALVDPSGKVLHVEPCKRLPVIVDGQPIAIRTWQAATMSAMRIYIPEKMPLLPKIMIRGKPAFGWIILPAPSFVREGKDKVKIAFYNVGLEQCSNF